MEPEVPRAESGRKAVGNPPQPPLVNLFWVRLLPLPVNSLFIEEKEKMTSTPLHMTSSTENEMSL